MLSDAFRAADFRVGTHFSLSGPCFSFRFATFSVRVFPRRSGPFRAVIPLSFRCRSVSFRVVPLSFRCRSAVVPCRSVPFRSGFEMEFNFYIPTVIWCSVFWLELKKHFPRLISIPKTLWNQDFCKFHLKMRNFQCFS